ncbi:MAG: universal stress protein [Desulfatibacillaceae bacterium]
MAVSTKEIKKILFPVDFTENVDPVLSYVVTMAQTHQAEVLVLHVVQDLGRTSVSFIPHANLDEFQRETEKHARDAMQQFVTGKGEQLDALPGFDTAIVTGPPADTIVENAKKEQASLIIMGTHGRKGLEHFIMGSVAERVIRLSPIPVMVVNPETA